MSVALRRERILLGLHRKRTRFENIWEKTVRNFQIDVDTLSFFGVCHDDEQYVTVFLEFQKLPKRVIVLDERK